MSWKSNVIEVAVVTASSWLGAQEPSREFSALTHLSEMQVGPTLGHSKRRKKNPGHVLGNFLFKKIF